MNRFLLALLITSTIPALGQEKINSAKREQVHHINWTITSIQDGTGKAVAVLSFPEAIYPDATSGLPVYPVYKAAPSGATAVSASLVNDQWQPLSEKEKTVIALQNIPGQTRINGTIATSRKEKFYTLEIFPLRKNSQTGQVEKLVSFDIAVNFSESSARSAPATSWATSSVLNNGTWYKIGVADDGIFKLTFIDLQKMGIEPQTISLANLGLFGQRGGLLSELNSLPKKDDLKEIDIYIEGGADGSFDNNDYIWFYGQGPHRWKISGNSFVKEPHLYCDTTYYFLTTDAANGNRISTAAVVTSAPNQFVSTYNDFKRHELEKSNFIKSGRRWFGESFEINTVQSFPFYFKNTDPSSPLQVTVSAALRSQEDGNFTVKINQSTFTLPLLQTSFTNSYDYYAKTNTQTFQVNPSGDNTQVELIYNKKPNSLAWLDYIEINARRKLIFDSEPLYFRDLNSAAPGNIAQFSVQNATSSLWLLDVTDPIEPKKITHNNGTFVNYADTVRTYLMFAQGTGNSPQLFGKIENQDLHATTQNEMVIVSHPKFLTSAENLADLHRSEGLSVAVVTTNQVYNEFSAGSKDASAIRDFMKMFYDRASGPSNAPKYLLLFGDGSYDNKGTASNITNFIPTWQSVESLHPINSIVSDDYFGLLDDNEGQMTFDKLDIAIGRLPVKSATEAISVVNKISHYSDPATMRSWRNKLLFVADDEDGSAWLNNTEVLFSSISTLHPEYDYDKIYIDAYRQEYTPGGQRYPEAREALVRGVEKGSLIVNYIGHGGETGWAHEQLLTVSDINGWTNLNSLPLFFTATCEFSRFDDHSRTSAGEYIMLNPKGGGIALMTTVRVVTGTGNQSVNVEFFKHALDSDNGTVPSIGDLYFLTKSPFNDPNSRSFTLLGDPAVKLAYPKDNVATLTINNLSVSQADTLKALSKVTVTGELRNLAGAKMTSFNGIVYPTVYDKESSINTLSNDGAAKSPVKTFNMWKNVIYKGKASVNYGEFTFSFIVPKDISYDYGIGRISFYAEDGVSDAHGFTQELYIGGTDTTAVADNSGPEAKLYMNDTKFVFGGLTNEQPNLLGLLYDEHGINTSGTGIGHDITAILDENTAKTIVLNDYYEADLDSYQSGKVLFPFKDLEEGRHTLRLKAWDVYNNSAEAYTEFVVAKEAKIALSHVLNYPNPFTTYTEFWFEHNQPVSGLDVQIQIFTISGKLVKTIEAYVNTEGFRANPIPWDGRDEFGDKIGRGVYIYRLKVRGSDNTYADKFEKLVILQ